MRAADPVVALLDDEFRAAEFVRKRKAWYLKSTEAIVLAELQPSQWDGAYYLNLAVWLHQLGDNDWPKEEQSHVRIRFSALAGTRVDALLSAIGPEGRPRSDLDELRILVREIAIPTLRSWRSLDGLRQAYASGALSQALVDRRAKALLD